jgi:hypothetical protein
MNLGQRPAARQIAMFAVAIGLFFALPCSGHQAWVLPNFFQSNTLPVWLSFDTTWGDKAFAPSQGPGLEQVWVVGPADQRVTPPWLYVGKTKTVGEIELKQAGTYRIEAFKPPTYWTRVVSSDGVTGKNVEKWLRKSKDLVGDAKIVRSDQYWSKAVTYVTAKSPTDAVLASQDDPLELVPVDHPSKIVSGTPFEVRVLQRGKPLPKQPIKIFRDGNLGHEPSSTHLADEAGVCRLTFDEAGKHLLVVQWERKTPESKLADIESLNFFLLVDVAAPE